MNRSLIPFLMALLSFVSSGNLLAAVDLKVTANPDPVLPGERIVYALTVTNTGTLPLTGVVVQDLPSTLVFVDGRNLPDGGTCPGTTCTAGERITWTIGNLAAKSSRTVHFGATVKTGGNAPAAGTALSNLAELTYDGGGTTVLTDVVAGSAPGLELAIADNRDPVVPGETVTYALSFGNSGTTNVLNTLLRAPLPAGTTFVSASPGGSVVSGNVEWTLGTVLSGAVGERSFTVQVGGSVSAGDVVLANAQLVDSLSSQSLVRARTETALAAATPVELYVTANPDPVLPGERIEYALTVTNTGTLPLTGVVVQDVPSTLVFVDGRNLPDGGTCPGTTCTVGELITWSIGSLAAKTSRTVHYEATVKTGGSAPPAGTVLSSLATLVYDGGAGSSITNLLIGNAPGLELSITDNRDPVVPGETVTYALSFGNSGTTNVLNTLLRAPLPVGTTFVSASPGGSVVNGNVQWTLGTLLSGAVGERSFTVQVDSGVSAGGVVIAGAQLADSLSSQSLVRARTETALAAATPVELYVTANPDPALPGERIEYTLTVTNTGALPLTGVVVQDVPATSVFVDGFNLPDGGTCPGTSCTVGELITWNIGSLAAKTSRTVHYEATVKTGSSGPPAGTVLSNLAELSYNGGATAVTSSVLVGNAPGLELSITDNRDPVVPGETVTYALSFGNSGTTNVLNTSLRAPLPVGTTFVSASPGGSVVNGNVQWTLGTLLSGAVGERSFTVQVDSAASAGGVVIAGAQLADSLSSQSLVRVETETALATATPVELYVTANPDPALPGERVEYTLTVTNTGTLPLTGVVVQDLPSTSVFVNGFILADGGTCPGISCQASERITWNIGSLAAKTSRTVHYEATVKTGGSAPPAGTVLSNLAELSYDGGATAVASSVLVGNDFGLELSITDNRDPVVPGESVTYTMNFGNASTVNSSNLLLRAPLPAGATLLKASPGGSVVNGNVEWLLGTVLSGAVGERSFTMQVDSGASAGDVVLADAQLASSVSSQSLVRAETETALAAATPVELYVTANPDPALPGERIEYALTVTNTGALPLTGVVVQDLPSAPVFVNGFILADGGTCSGTSCQAGERITWNIGSLAAKTSRTVHLEATVQTGGNAAPPAGTVLGNLATLVYDGGAGSSTTNVVVGGGPGLELSITDDRDPVVPGETVTYTLAFGNRTDSIIDNLTLRAPIPQGTTFVSATAGGELEIGAVKWELKNRLIPGAVDVRRFTVTVTGAAAAGDVLQASAQLVDSTSGVDFVRTETVTEIAESTPLVRLASVFDADPVVSGGLNYSLSVTNTSGLPITGVVVSELIPQFVTVSSNAILDGGVCPNTSCQTGERITWNIGSMAAGETQTVSYQAVVAFSLEDGTNLRSRATLIYDVGSGSSDIDVPVGVVIDADEDGLPDQWELDNFGTTNASSGGDFDQDGLNNLGEFQNATDPTDIDTDNDGLKDGFEVANGFDPLDPVDASQDPDGDGFTNLEEFNCGSNPKSVASFCTTELRDEIIIDFGGIGLWAWVNDTGWQKLNNASPDKVVMGDVDGNGQEDVIADFSSTFGGIFIKRNGGGWSKLHNFAPQLLATGDLDNNGKDDIVIDFGGIGLWARMNDTSWLKLNNSSPDQIVVADMDGNGQDDVVADFASTFGGIFVKRNQGGWSKLHNFTPEAMAVGDLDNNGKDDLVIDFGGIGLWARMNDSAWLKLNNSSPALIATGDLDGNGADDVMATFPAGVGGVWQKLNLGGWSQLNTNAPDELVTGDVNGSGKDDIIGKFGSTLGGIFVKRDQGPWQKLHNTSPDSLATGNLDSN